MTDRVQGSAALVEKVSRLNRAKSAAARRRQGVDDLKAEILDDLGYDAEDPKPEPVEVVDENGSTLFEVKRGTWRGLNQKAFRAERPDVYAQYETSKATLTIKYDGD